MYLLGLISGFKSQPSSCGWVIVSKLFSLSKPVFSFVIHVIGLLWELNQITHMYTWHMFSKY